MQRRPGVVGQQPARCTHEERVPAHPQSVRAKAISSACVRSRGAASPRRGHLPLGPISRRDRNASRAVRTLPRLRQAAARAATQRPAGTGVDPAPPMSWFRRSADHQPQQSSPQPSIERGRRRMGCSIQRRRLLEHQSNRAHHPMATTSMGGSNQWPGGTASKSWTVRGEVCQADGA